MGLYYTPQPPHIGSAQPLEAKKLTPPSGPPPQNPPFNGGSRINQAVLGCWAAVVIAAAVLPTLPRNLTPPSTAPATSRPVPNTALQNILIAWTPPAPMPIVARNLTPPSAPGVTFDAKATAVTTQGAPSSPIANSTLTVGALGSLVIGVFTAVTDTTLAVATAMTWNGVTMTPVSSKIASDNKSSVYVYAIVSPATGNHSCSCTFTNGSGSQQVDLDCFSFAGTSTVSVAAAIPPGNVLTDASSPAGLVYPAAAFAVTTTSGDAACAVCNSVSTNLNGVNVGTLINAEHGSLINYVSLYNLALGASTNAQFTDGGVNGFPAEGIAFDIVKPAAAAIPPPSVLSQAILNAWTPTAPAPIVSGPLPPQPAAIAAFPFRGSSVPTEVLAAWTPAPFFQVVQELLDPPLTGTNDPPFMGGAAVPQAILNAWIPPAPAPIVIDNLVPPITGTNDPPFAGGAKVPQAVLSAWIAAAPAPIVASSLPPQPVVVATFTPSGARVPLEVLDAWIAPAPGSIVARNLTPPSGPAAFLPSGSFVPREVLINWLPAAPAAIVGPNLPPQPVVTFTPVGARVSLEVLGAWQLPAPLPIVAVNLTPPQSGPTNPPFVGGAAVPPAVQIAWLPAAPAPIVARNLTPPSGPVAAFLPAIRLQTEILTAWQVPAPAPIVAQNLTPPSGPVVSTPLFVNPQASPVFLASWTSVPWTIVLFSPTPIETAPPPPIGVSVRQEILNAWLPAAPNPIVARNLTPPSGPSDPPFLGSLVPTAVQVAWLPLPPAPIVATLLNPPQSGPPTLVFAGGARVPGEVLINWLPPVPAPLLARNGTPPSGPIASDPPFAGGAQLKLEIELAWQAAQPGYPPLKAINTTPPSGPPPIVSAEIHAKPFFVSFGLRPL